MAPITIDLCRDTILLVDGSRVRPLSGTYFVFGIVVNVIVFMAILSVLSVPDLSRRNGTRKIKTQVL